MLIVWTYGALAQLQQEQGPVLNWSGPTGSAAVGGSVRATVAGTSRVSATAGGSGRVAAQAGGSGRVTATVGGIGGGN